MNVIVLTSAKQDIKIAYQFYEQQQQGLGKYFINSLQADIDSLEMMAGIHPVYTENIHRMLTKRFPFAVYYSVEQETVKILSVFDCRSRSAQKTYLKNS